MYCFTCISFAIRPSGRKSAVKLSDRLIESEFGCGTNTEWVFSAALPQTPVTSQLVGSRCVWLLVFSFHSFLEHIILLVKYCCLSLDTVNQFISFLPSSIDVFRFWSCSSLVSKIYFTILQLCCGSEMICLCLALRCTIISAVVLLLVRQGPNMQRLLMSLRHPSIHCLTMVISRRLSRIDPYLLWNTMKKLASLILLPHSDPSQVLRAEIFGF